MLVHVDEGASQWLNSLPQPNPLVGVINTGAHNDYLRDKKVAAHAKVQSGSFCPSVFYHQDTQAVLGSSQANVGWDRVLAVAKMLTFQ